MEAMSFVLVIFLFIGLVRRVIGDSEYARRLGPGMPARFLGFTGRRLMISKRTHAHSSKE